MVMVLNRQFVTILFFDLDARSFLINSSLSDLNFVFWNFIFNIYNIFKDSKVIKPF